MKKVAVILGSDSDFPVMQRAVAALKQWEIPVEAHVFSAHRTPGEAAAFAASARENGFGVIIAAAGKAAKLHEGDRIKLGDVDVSTFYNKEKQTEYTTFKVFSFEVEGEQSAKPKKKPVDDVEPEPEDEDSDLPF